MKYQPYSIESSDSGLQYEFYSHGPKGNVTKRVRYIKFYGSPNTYNLGFGDVQQSDQVDDLIVSDNKDGEKVLATVVMTMGKFFESYPDKSIYITGSTASRTRLYRMAISKHIEEFENFEILGLIEDKLFLFEKNISYEAFVIRLKKPITLY